MTDADLVRLCGDVIARPLFAPQMSPEIAEAILALHAEKEHWRKVQYRRVALAWIDVECGWWTTNSLCDLKLWYEVCPSHRNFYWLFGGFRSLSEGQLFAQQHTDALVRGVDDLDVADEVLYP